MTDERDGERDPVDGAGAVGHGLTRGYVRRPHVEAEIVALPDVAAPDFMQVAARAEAIETLVHAIRRLVRAGNAVGVKELGTVLAGRVQRLVADTAMARFPGRPDDRHELSAALTERLWREVIDPSPRTEFWEVHFRSALIRASFTLAKRQTPPEGVQHLSIGRDEDDQRGRGTVDEPAGAEDWDPELLLAEALSQLEGKVRMAAFLKLKDLKEQSNDPQEATIASVMGVSDRMVRNYLAAARATLEPWLRAHREEP